MVENLQFIYKEEYWFISAFLKTSNRSDDKKTSVINGLKKSKEIEELLRKKLNTLKDNDIFRKDLKDEILELARNISLSCSWKAYMTNFPYNDENSERSYDTLGFFQFDVEYYKNDPNKKQSIRPILIQQIPYIVLNELKSFANREENKGILFDTESPIYVFVTSDKTTPAEISWNPQNIDKYKKVISYWTEVYSGQWEDYSVTLYDKRTENNLSNRLSELHFIRRNSGFIYMAEQNYIDFFESYMKKWVLDPTPKIRAVLFAFRTINESLDLLFLKTNSDVFMNLETIEKKIKNLRLLRGLIQTQLSAIYNELDYNRRQHYTSVLNHLIQEFGLKNIETRVNEKFTTIYDAMEELYLKKNEENQKRTEKGLNLLNLLFGAGVLADLVGVLMIALTWGEGNPGAIALNAIVGVFIIAILVATIAVNVRLKFKIKEENIGKTVDAVIEDGKGNVVLIKRKYPPFKDYLALPGGFIEKGETPQKALLREVKEETNLTVRIVEKIGLYDDEGRDPRGIVHSTAFKCKIVGEVSDMKSGDDSQQVGLYSINQLKNKNLAFDHKKILKDAGL
ncbi:MAG: NUDIX hydrolase [Candidatus Lokiarchaeota archaeon]|nr:NUDIX hydrolase [Candidatus Lokiarchaeota archaeon]